jgi:hypothetical protein
MFMKSIHPASIIKKGVSKNETPFFRLDIWLDERQDIGLLDTWLRLYHLVAET